MSLLKYVYFCAQKSVIKSGNSPFQDLINAPCICGELNQICFSHYEMLLFTAVLTLACMNFLHYFNSAISNPLSIAISISPEWMVLRFNCIMGY